MMVGIGKDLLDSCGRRQRLCVAWVRAEIGEGEYYRDGFADGQLIGAEVVASEWRYEKMMARPYFSISFSLDIIRNVRAAMKNSEITSLSSGGNGG